MTSAVANLCQYFWTTAEFNTETMNSRKFILLQSILPLSVLEADGASCRRPVQQLPFFMIAFCTVLHLLYGTVYDFFSRQHHRNVIYHTFPFHATWSDHNGRGLRWYSSGGEARSGSWAENILITSREDVWDRLTRAY